MQQIIEVEHCGNDHLEPIYSICEIPVHGFPKPQNGGLWTSPSHLKKTGEVTSKTTSGLFCINWGRLVKMYDGIWLTVRGMMETCCSYPYSLHCWDCETVFLFNEKPIIEVLTSIN